MHDHLHLNFELQSRVSVSGIRCNRVLSRRTTSEMIIEFLNN